MKINRSILIKFIYKFFFILKAAADGWIVKPIDENNYDFYKYILKSNKLCKIQLNVPQFLDNYACDLAFLI
jgi:hypothetical protein